MLLAGNYIARARHWKYGRSSKGTDFVELTFHVAAESEYIKAYLYLSEAAWPRSCESLKACGWDGADFGDLAGMGSQDVEIVVAEEEYDGKISYKVKWINPIGGAGAPELDDKDRRTLIAKMNARIKSMQGHSAKPKAKPAKKDEAEDDIPF